MSRKRFATERDVAAVETIFAATPPNTSITGIELVERVGRDLRTVRDAISQIVVEGGLPIIPDRAGGYQVCTIVARLEREIPRLQSHSKETGLRADGLQSFLVRAGLAEASDDRS